MHRRKHVTQSIVVRLDGIERALPESFKPPQGRDAGADRAANAPFDSAQIVNGGAHHVLPAAEGRISW